MRDRLVRRERIIEAVREILSEILLKEMKDPRLHGVVISAVELSGDLKLARAFFSVIGDTERERQALDGLHQAKGVLRREMARRMRMHNPPDLEFRRDKGFERADRVSRLLDQIAGDRTNSTTDSAEDGAPSEQDATPAPQVPDVPLAFVRPPEPINSPARPKRRPRSPKPGPRPPRKGGPNG